MATGEWNPDDIARLVSRLTLEQKVAQLSGLNTPELFGQPDEDLPNVPGIDAGRLKQLRPHGLGHLSLAWFLGGDADTLRTQLAKIQAGVREVTPFGIGALVHIEGINGFLHASGSQFPTAWAQATTWDPALVRQASAVTSAHTRDAGIQLLFAPVMDINRDPRWGRVHETYGEDPELAAQLSVAFVQGVHQEEGVLATGKHFLGYGNSEGALNQAATQLGRRALIDEYAEPFRRAIAEAGLAAVMNSYNEIDGVPVAANHWLLTEFLRGTLGFDGLVLGDYDAVNMLRTHHRAARTEGEAAVQALSAGLDVELPGNTNYVSLVDEVAAGRLDEKVVDVAVGRVLAVKARVGLVPDFGPRPAPAVRPDRAEAAEIRRALAARSTVLLQNDGTLPLTPGERRIVVVGPAADELRIHFGAYTSVSNAEMPLGMMAVMEGRVPGVDPGTFNFTDIFQTRMPGMDATFEGVARDIHPEARTVFDGLKALDAKVDFVSLGRFEKDDSQDAEMVRAAVADADLVLAVLGERTGWVGNNTAGEGQTSVSPSLPGDQEDLLDHLAATGKPLVTVIVSGRPLLLGKAARASNAILLAPLLGEEAGTTIAHTLYGLINPSGKLPSTFPRHLGQIPLYHGHHHGSGYAHPTGTRHGYGDLDTQGPLYAFGHGLSYTDFEVTLDEQGGAQDGTAVEVVHGVVRARLTVVNTGAVEGETVVQLYARDEFASVVRPVRQLIAFARVALAAGERRSIVLEAPVERLHYTLTDGRRGIEPGDVTVLAGLAADALSCAATITVG
ncbi:glycoside hydrolase family 3 N-terminal domain-containing protein [Streptomyces violaceusniger]|uniref:Glycoside hydrolase family 3 domain protein n=1 Tax=Streptomyces violaceusniger (strain Tu 4113) TaxID=653045 RepID=G2P4W9_STRV4|nr:glycoside hydrolase family 3 N-terminal domain-containing protein [Streptomyces violaceusniger]AEM84146.1 glycoside hydrolase family 3 domain protein [Streptomyces violaceusniger Tu 4113]